MILSYFMMEQALRLVQEHPDYRVLQRVPTTYNERKSTRPQVFYATVLDLETMGMNAPTDEIIELGMLTFAFTNEEGILSVIDCYNELNDPGRPIPAEITKITGISDTDVSGKHIDWVHVSAILSKTHLIICHNSGFDRNFLELQTPEDIATIVTKLPFACTLKDIDWKERGIESSKLDYINWKLGYFYEGHRAINDCWALFNALIHAEGSFEELKSNVRKKELLICAVNAPFDKKELLKNRQYRWSDGTEQLPKCWWRCVSQEEVDQEQSWLAEEIFGQMTIVDKLPTKEINARIRYSFRAYCMDI